MAQPPQIVYALGFSRWKRPVLERFLDGSRVIFVRTPLDIPAGATLAVWGNSSSKKLLDTQHVLCVEDGFLRSAGLGANHVKPLSWVIDDRGIYFDSSRPSRLEILLQAANFDSIVIERAQKLRKQILMAGISKYNIVGSYWERPNNVKRVILVAGQVEGDASICYGAPDIKSNIGLLQAVQAANPESYIVYKPHPDVEAGLRHAGLEERQAVKFCNEVVTNTDPVQMLTQVDELYTITSLIGFEALLRGIPVTCYGQPFYSGWGLTNDMCPVHRRTRKITIDELVAGALIEYPLYVSRFTNEITNAETAVNELTEWRDSGPSKMSPWLYFSRFFLKLWVALRLRILVKV